VRSEAEHHFKIIMIVETLKNLGLTEKEAKVYVASLRKKSQTATEIAKEAKINRVTTYSILEKLLKKGLINTYKKINIQYFNATDPEIVFRNYKTKVNDFKKVLPDLKRINGKTPHPQIRYFEGINGIKAIYEDTLTSKTEILNYANSEIIRSLWPNYDEEYVKKRVKKKIFLRGIAPFDKSGLKVQKEDKDNCREILLVPGKEFSFTNEINIYDKKVAICSFKDELSGMIIESKEIAKTQRDIFKMAWQFAKLQSTILSMNME